MRSVPSPGFQIMRSLPASPNTWSSPAPPVSVSLPAPPNSRSLPPLPSRVSLPAWPNSMIVAGAAGQRVVAGAAEQLGRRQRAVGLVERDRVVAALAEHLDQGGVGDGRLAALDGDGAAVDENVSGRVAADTDEVIGIVAEHGQQAGARGKASLDSHWVVLSRGCPPRRRVSAGSPLDRPESKDRLEAALRAAWRFSGDIVNFFCASAPCAPQSRRAQGRLANEKRSRFAIIAI